MYVQRGDLLHKHSDQGTLVSHAGLFGSNDWLHYEAWNQVIDVDDVAPWGVGLVSRLCHVIPYQVFSYHIMMDSYEKYTRTDRTTVES